MICFYFEKLLYGLLDVFSAKYGTSCSENQNPKKIAENPTAGVEDVHGRKLCSLPGRVQIMKKTINYFCCPIHIGRILYSVFIFRLNHDLICMQTGTQQKKGQTHAQDGGGCFVPADHSNAAVDAAVSQTHEGSHGQILPKTGRGNVNFKKQAAKGSGK